MARIVQLTLAILVLSASPGIALARFGKAGSPSDDDRSNNSSNTHSHSSSSSHSNNGESHTATPVGSSRPVVVVHNPCAAARDRRCWRYTGWPAYFWEPTYFYSPPSYVPVSVPDTQGVELSQGLYIRSEITGDVMGLSTLDGASATAQLRIEGVKWGISFEGRHVAITADDGSSSVDHLSFLNGFLTYALLGNERGRLRLEAGANTAFAPNLIVLSPAVGASFAIGFDEHFGLEGVARASLVPHTQVELAGGLSYALGGLGLRLGWRRLYLNDNGLVDGVAHSDTFSGPYFGVGMAF